MIALAVLIIFPLCMVAACCTDVTSMTIPNKIIFVLLGGFAVLAPLTGMEFNQIGWHLGVGAAVLAIGFALFTFNAFGGGDAKLMAATALWLGPEHLVAYLAATAVLGGVLALILVGFRSWPIPVTLVRMDWVNRLHDKELGIPYGIALGPAGIYAFLESGWMDYVTANAIWLN